MARLLLRLCALPRSPHERLGLRLTPLDGLDFDLGVVLAAQQEGGRTVKQMTRKRRNPETGKYEHPSAEVLTATLLNALYVEGR